MQWSVVVWWKEKMEGETRRENQDNQRPPRKEEGRQRTSYEIEDERGKTKEQSEARVIELFTDPGQRRETERGVYRQAKIN